MKFTNQSDTWQDLTRVKPRVTSAKRHVAQPVQRTDGIGNSGIGNPRGMYSVTSKSPKHR
jgi:hypothetical protein